MELRHTVRIIIYTRKMKGERVRLGEALMEDD
jgi:hypothetical protein